MKVQIRRQEEVVEYEVERVVTLLEALNRIRREQDSSLAFSSGCRSSVCGSCAVRVNGKEELACAYKLQEGDVVEPLKNMPVIRDLVVDAETALEKNKQAKAWLEQYRAVEMTHEEEKLNALQSDCILCGACYSACPVFEAKEAFRGPFALTRVWRYVSDKREGAQKEHIDTVQNDGVWDCTLCDGCTLVCPQGISSKRDIEKLRAKSAQYGYMDPNFGSFGGFGGGFGFDGSAPQF